MNDVVKSALLIRIAAPMQAWGSSSLFEIRDTQSEPTKSGIIGLLGCACGKSRNDFDFITKCCQMQMGVLVIKEGKRLWDYHVSGGGYWINGGSYGVASANGKNTGSPVLSRRCYLSDADFIVALIGETSFLNAIESGLKKPVWSIYLGRKAFPPSTPLFITKTFDKEIKKALINGLLNVIKNEDWLKIVHGLSSSGKEFRCPGWFSKFVKQTASDKASIDVISLRMILECTRDEGSSVEDIPITFEKINRKYTRRYVKNDYLDINGIKEEIHAGTSLSDKA